MVLIPFPYAAEDHQRFNAEAIVAAGAGTMIADRAFNRASFLDLLNEALAGYDRMKDSVKRLAIYDAAERIVEKIYG
jgi:UDP-N-acetylglucosamine--N-acetylmuramyl-(pentapeptide) pyrophosphoryl-undecaprenol N-acetylglucosamine transferase